MPLSMGESSTASTAAIFVINNNMDMNKTTHWLIFITVATAFTAAAKKLTKKVNKSKREKKRLKDTTTTTTTQGPNVIHTCIYTYNT